MKPYTWQQYSSKLTKKILKPQCQGALNPSEGMRLVSAEEGRVKLAFLVDEEDGVVADARFQAFGPSALIGALEVACELALRKNYQQIKRMTADVLDNHGGGFPEETYAYLNTVLTFMDQAMMQCNDMVLSDDYIESPMPNSEGDRSEYPGFTSLSKTQKIAIIEELIESDIRPYIELDAGGIRIVDLKDNDIVIAYEGACTSCYSATGATLNAICQIVQSKIHPDLTVTPDPSTLQF